MLPDWAVWRRCWYRKNGRLFARSATLRKVTKAASFAIQDVVVRDASIAMISYRPAERRSLVIRELVHQANLFEDLTKLRIASSASAIS
jgi:hypothetical protein